MDILVMINCGTLDTTVVMVGYESTKFLHSYLRIMVVQGVNERVKLYEVSTKTLWVHFV